MARKTVRDPSYQAQQYEGDVSTKRHRGEGDRGHIAAEQQQQRHFATWQEEKADSMLRMHPFAPLRALWDSFLDCQIFGPKVPMAIITHRCCGMEQRATSAETHPTYYPYWSGATPLMLAAHANRVDVACALISLGASIEVEDERGWTAVHYAAANGNTDMLSILLMNGADAVKFDINGLCPRQIATTTASVQMLMSNVHNQDEQPSDCYE